MDRSSTGCPIRIARRLLRTESGAALVEYGLLAALVGLAMVGGLRLFGQSVTELYVDSNDRIVAHVPGVDDES